MSKAVYKNQTLFDRLRSIYNEKDAKEALKEINLLIQKYKDKVNSKPYRMSEKDVILITYANQILKDKEIPLVTLERFLKKKVSNLINSVHILPFYPYSSDDGFSVIEYKEVSLEVGSWQDIKRISKNYRIMFDGVINHISQYSSWFKSFLDNDPKYKDFFIDVDPNSDLSMVVRPRTLPLLHSYKDCDGKMRYIWTTFSQDQVDLNYANYKVLVAVLDVLLFYIQMGASLLRLDAIAFIWKDIGSSCIHLPQTHELIKLIRQVIHEVACEVVIVTETNVPHSENISYFGSGDDEAQMVYNFALPPLLAYAILKQDTKILTKWAKSLTLPSDKVCFFNFTASHDGCGLRAVSDILTQDDINFLIDSVKSGGGFVSYRSNGKTKSPYELNASYIDIISNKNESDHVRAKKMILTQAVMLAMPGVPGIYFHSLVGSTNYLDGVKKSGAFRAINREKLDYDSLIDELEKEGTLRNLIFEDYKKLLLIRKKHKAFDPYGEFEFLDLHHKVFAILRKSKDDKEIAALFNFSNKRIEIEFDLFGSGYDLVGKKRVDSGCLSIEPYSFLWIQKIL